MADHRMFSPISQAFKPIFGQHTWNVEQGWGSFLTFEFGAPTVETYGGVKGIPFRRASVHGRYHLWIYMCTWELRQEEMRRAHSESSRKRIRGALWDLCGQSLMTVAVDPKLGSTRFDFSNDWVLETSRYPRTRHDEQWKLRRPSGYLILRANGTFDANGSGKWMALR